MHHQFTGTQEPPSLDRERFWGSPSGKARLAREAGRSLFQIELSLSRVTAIPGTFATSSFQSGTADITSLLESIEQQGWRLEHVGYVHRVTGTVSRDNIFSPGEKETISGDVLGVYLFRSTGSPLPELNFESNNQGLIESTFAMDATTKRIRAQILENPRTPIDDKIALLTKLGGHFSWTSGTSCRVSVGQELKHFSNGREFGFWFEDFLRKLGDA